MAHGQENRFCGRRGRQAFTLIELLLALSLTGAVFAVIGSTAIQALELERTLAAKAVKRARHQSIARIMHNDWNARIHGEFTIELDPNRRPRLTMHCLVTQPAAAIHEPQFPAQVTYRLRRESDGKQTLVLQRDVEWLVPDAALSRASSVIARNLESVEVSLHDGRHFEALSADNDLPAERIRAVRIRMHDAHGAPWVVTLLAGRLFERQQ